MLSAQQQTMDRHLILQAERYVDSGIVALKQKDLPSAQSLLANAVAIYENSGYPGKHRALVFLSEVHSELGNFGKGLQYAHQALEEARRVGDTAMAMYGIYSRIGTALLKSGRSDSAIQAYQQAFFIARRNQDAGSVFESACQLSSAFINNGDHQKALQLLENLIYDDMFTAHQNLELVVFALGACNQSNQLRKARKYYGTLYNAIQKDPGGGLARKAYFELIKFKLLTREFWGARQLIDQCELIYRNENMYEQLAQSYLLRFVVDTAEHRLPQAIFSYKKFREISDSVSLMNSERNVANLEKQFAAEVALRDEYNAQNVEFLLTKGKIQEAELKRTKSKTYILLAGSLIMCLFLLIGLIAYRLRQKNNRLLEKQKQAIGDQNRILKQLVEQQQELIKEKDWLVKEVHHRVKNNLQLIVNLLNIQSKYLSDESALSAIRNSQNRVRAMSFVHQRLYEVDTFTHINIADYVDELIRYLKEALAPASSIRFIVDILPFQMSIIQAVPIGLILNEAVTNAIKYAFHSGEPGIIEVSLSESGPDRYILRIKDNGIGMPPDLDWQKSKSLGFTIMQTMAEQISANFKVYGKAGVELRIEFSPRPYSSGNSQHQSEPFYA
jgi:two-component sensor histidine kinase